MGTPDFAVPSLETLHNHGYPISAVVTAPDKPRGRGQQVSPTPIRQFASRAGLPVLQPESLKDPTFVERLKSLRPDIIVVVAFRILPPEVFTVPTLGSFNLHASLLPKYRGAAPINWAIMKGETETGVTTFMLREKVDTGGILLQERVPISPEDDAGTMHDNLAVVGARVVLDTVRLIEQGRAVQTPQDDSQATPAPKLFREDCRINWDRPATEIHNRVRGLSPSPTAFSTHRGRVLKICKTQVLGSHARGSPGEVMISPQALYVSTRDRMLSVLELQQEGKKRMSIEEFLRGYRISSAERLE